ncbi:MAG: DUF1571 domain-containing protein [Gemmataceae bacterium]|uniref:DUF1571 domain-containing protein n=1 Tax=Thermogemmata fonticola TaxID=2755323 RepID=A0A7V8VDR7_9BACT|nr:DUF1571 domain-containing protein [Thermogemmata fonticola]MBA2226155.1 DUF1571 domain-containing protein [Thermogemmata fonticola]MCX8139726.1 DUF1571 domain-containing protein [Gemmataceae bacterium]
MRRAFAILSVVAAGWWGGSLAQITAGSPKAASPSSPAAATSPSAASPPTAAAGVLGAKGVEALSAMLREAAAAHARLRDYTCTFTRQERLQGVLGAEEVALMQVRVQPLGVRVRFTQPQAVAGLELAYSAQSRPGKVRLRPAGPDGLKGFRLLETDDPKFLAAHRYPLPQWTIGALLQRLHALIERERGLRNPIEVLTADYLYAQQDVTRYELLLRRPHAFRSAARAILYVDKKTKLPLRYEAYTSTQPSAPHSDLLEMYSYTDLRLNTGLSEKVFAE